MAHALDTAAATERLAAAGLDGKQARAIATVIAQAKQANADFATKADVLALRTDLKAAMLRLERRLILSGLVGLGLLFTALRLTGSRSPPDCPPNRPKRIVATVSPADDAQRANLATKADLVALQGDFSAGQAASEAAITGLRTEMKNDLAALEIRLLRSGITIALAAAGLLFAALRLTG